MGGGNLKYPDDFDVPAFPAGRPVALTRVLAVAIMSVFLLIGATCILLFYTQRSVHIHPFLVSINPVTGQWDVVGHHHKDVAELSATRTLQESAIGKFMRNWFLLTDIELLNEARWKACDRETECTLDGRTDRMSEECALYCLSSDEIFTQFIEQVVPEYQLRIENGETWKLDMFSLQITPIGTINKSGGTWQIRANVLSSTTGEISILAYAQVQYADQLFPQTMGYYVSDFNAYKIDR